MPKLRFLHSLASHVLKVLYGTILRGFNFLSSENTTEFCFLVLLLVCLETLILKGDFYFQIFWGSG